MASSRSGGTAWVFKGPRQPGEALPDALTIGHDGLREVWNGDRPSEREGWRLLRLPRRGQRHLREQDTCPAKTCRERHPRGRSEAALRSRAEGFKN
jgi:hypothetical protein